MEEKFIIIIDFPAYRISNTGRIQSRWQRGSFYKGFIIENIWKDLPTHNSYNGGYPMVHLCDGKGKVKSIRIHTLVAKYFIGERPKDKQLIRHLDSNPTNNNITNLAYGTYLENENDKIQNGTWNMRNGGAKLTPKQVIEIRNKADKGESQKNLGVEYGVSRPTITRIINNKIWKML